MSPRPVLYVLAGVNGAGKSSIGGQHLADHGIGEDDWHNPDRVTRGLVARGMALDDANAAAWTLGRDLLATAIETRRSFVFETTLGGNTIPRLIATAAATHDVILWYCGLDTPERHIARVRARVARGGHDIPDDRIRTRFESSQRNLIALLPDLAELLVYDNSTEAGTDADDPVPEPMLVLHVAHGEVLYPSTHNELVRTPHWAMPIVEAALELAGR